MDSTTSTQTWRDVDSLLQAVSDLRHDSTSVVPSGHSDMEDAIVRAHRLVSPDLYIIDRLRQSGVQPDFTTLFGEKMQEKIGALIFLTKQKLLDIEHSTLNSRDIEDARRDLSTYVEILFHARAIDALGIFYDFAVAQRDSRVPWLWQNVCSRTLYLMALLVECWPKVIAFLENRPVACRKLNELLATTKPEIAGKLYALTQEFARVQTQAEHANAPASDAPPPYLQHYRSYEQGSPGGGGTGVSSFLTAQDRIHSAVQDNDFPAMVKWIADGSPAAMQSVLHTAVKVLPTDLFVMLIEKALSEESIDPVRLAALVLELGEVNKAQSDKGGLPKVNKILQQIAMVDDESRLGIAKLAVGQLCACGAYEPLAKVAEDCPLQDVAEEAMKQLKGFNQFSMLERIARQRPSLQPIFQAMRREHLELETLVDDAASCPNEEMAMVYLQRLEALNAIPQLEHLSHHQTFVGDLAYKILVKLKLG
ncbi:MAG: hypothetical protein ACYDBB_04340 [Armatimonadota bacterium]